MRNHWRSEVCWRRQLPRTIRYSRFLRTRVRSQNAIGEALRLLRTKKKQRRLRKREAGESVPRLTKRRKQRPQDKQIGAKLHFLELGREPPRKNRIRLDGLLRLRRIV